MQRDWFLVVWVKGRCLLLLLRLLQLVVLLRLLLIVMPISLFGRAKVVVIVLVMIRVLVRLLQPCPSVDWQRQICWP